LPHGSESLRHFIFVCNRLLRIANKQNLTNTEQQIHCISICAHSLAPILQGVPSPLPALCRIVELESRRRDDSVLHKDLSPEFPCDKEMSWHRISIAYEDCGIGGKGHQLTGAFMALLIENVEVPIDAAVFSRRSDDFSSVLYYFSPEQCELLGLWLRVMGLRHALRRSEGRYTWLLVMSALSKCCGRHGAKRNQGATQLPQQSESHHP